jgi:transcriptional regulator with XRE-family HTH domain/tetratricopeptide (TPR) repeat protein
MAVAPQYADFPWATRPRAKIWALPQNPAEPGMLAPVSLGQRLRNQRERLHLSQDELARLVGVTERTIRRWERDEVVPQPHYRRRCCSALGIRQEDLFAIPPGEAAAVAGVSEGRGPSQLPPAVLDFTGRSTAAAAAVDLLRGHRSEGGHGAARMLLVVGPAGVGKTTFAVQVAHRLRDQFPDGQLFVDLGADETGQRDPARVLTGFLRALGVHPVAIPSDLDERSALFRSWLADRRVLLLLDNAVSEQQVRPLLPAGRGCAVLVTSRAILAGLEGAAVTPLTMLAPDEAVELLARVAGAERVAQELPAAQAIAELCGGLPLALRIVGARLATRPEWSLPQMVHRLSDERRRLDELSAGDLEVRASIAISYRALSSPDQRALCLLAVPDAVAITDWQVAALLELDMHAADLVIQRLLNVHLLQSVGADQAGQPRYRLHSLVHLFASGRLREAESDTTRMAALERMLGAQLALAERARAALGPADAALAFRGGARRWLPDADCADAIALRPLDWFEAQRTDLVTAVEQASSAGLAELAWELLRVLPGFLILRGYWQDFSTVAQHAIDANLRAGNLVGATHARLCRGVAHLGSGDLDQAEASLGDCLHRYQELGVDEGVPQALLAFGLLASWRGDVTAAAARFRECAVLFRRAGEEYGEALARHGLADIWRLQGNVDAAEAELERCLTTFRRVGERYHEGVVLHTLAQVRHGQGCLTEAGELLRQSLIIFRAYRDDYLQVHVLAQLGQLHLAQGDRQAALACLRQCRTICLRHGFAAERQHVEGLLTAAAGTNAGAGRPTS